MGSGISQGITATQFYLYGRSHFTRTGWESASKAYKPGELENYQLKDRVYLVTGGNAGVGREVSGYLASKGGRVYMVCRDKGRGEAAKQAIIKETNNDAVSVLVGDCGLQADVRRIMEEFGQLEDRVDAVVCNAGALDNSKTLTAEGVETTFATHLLNGSYLLTSLALPLLEAADDPRVVMVSSGGMYTTKFPSWATATATNPKKQYDGQLAYAYAKRGQVLLCERWTKTHPNVKFVSTHPGWTDTAAVSKAYGDQKKYLEPMRTPWQGAEGIAWLCATPGDQLEGGAFYLDRKPQRKHLAGPFFSEGSFTKNTEGEVDVMMDSLAKAVNDPSAPKPSL
mmetsp:Transcript_20295/g.24265  ORF Transcript_20295/g.24265 Transcript_20295/m.24265 type:complete len:339 (-) Transcript_20295:243-1259(-)|eukprot:CAMPEP_0197856138 /NCGR_PEP_ID=MMETSP1438-20131217/27958_1 /TAXON_ID=1461541 /ORGANISM="Pterosperma sp., Strain CCMP1384" /LENGTH=338 /DNA_ID=CAMNT_0043471489 /DNA_START=164 /DNA_END=1180 /DNA_ORIENTATION=+